MNRYQNKKKVLFQKKIHSVLQDLKKKGINKHSEKTINFMFRYGNLINQAPPKKELNALSLLKSNRENKTDELLGRKMEEKKDNHEFKTNYQNKSVQENNYDKQFEEELQRALAESIQTFQEKNEKLKRDLDDENNFNDYSQEDNLPDNGNFYEEYKKMIYPNESKRKFHEVYNENSMFPLIESDLSQRYFYLEKINK